MAREAKLKSEMFTLEQARRQWPKLGEDRLSGAFEALALACIEFDINTPDRQAAFLAHVTVQTLGMQRTKNEDTLATVSKRYEGRRDLGNVNRGDGVKFRPRGLLKDLVGRAAYRDAGKALDLPLEAQPELAEKIEVLARVAAWQWAELGMNKLADDPQPVPKGKDDHPAWENNFLRIAQKLGVAPEYHKRAVAWREWRALLGLEAKAA